MMQYTKKCKKNFLGVLNLSNFIFLIFFVSLRTLGVKICARGPNPVFVNLASSDPLWARIPVTGTSSSETQGRSLWLERWQKPHRTPFYLYWNIHVAAETQISSHSLHKKKENVWEASQIDDIVYGEGVEAGYLFNPFCLRVWSRRVECVCLMDWLSPTRMLHVASRLLRHEPSPKTLKPTLLLILPLLELTKTTWNRMCTFFFL